MKSDLQITRKNARVIAWAAVCKCERRNVPSFRDRSEFRFRRAENKSEPSLPVQANAACAQRLSPCNDHCQISAKAAIDECRELRFVIVVMVDVAFCKVDVGAKFVQCAFEAFGGGD